MNQDPLFKLALGLSRALLWLFTTQSGILCLGSSLLFLLFVRFAKVLRERSLLYQAAGKKMGFGSALSSMGEESLSLFALAAANLPTLLGLAAVLSLNLALSGTLSQLDTFLNLQKKIQEYSLVVKNLERRYKVARLECLAQDSATTGLRITYFDQGGKAVPGAEQELSLPGKDIFLDALVLNFAYSGIESGEKRNLAIPYRIFSEFLAQEEGIKLLVSAEGGSPYVFQREAQDVYGLEKSAFDVRLGELLDAAFDPEKARKAGILRSVYGNAVHRIMKKGDSFLVWVEQSGGLSIKEERAF